MEKFLKNQQIPLTQVIDPNTGQVYYSPQNVVYQDKIDKGATYLKDVIVDSSTSASYALTASYAITSGGGGATNTGSLLTTASFASPNLTFTKGDKSSFNVNISTLTVTSASYALTSSFATRALSASYAANGGVTQLLAGPNVTLSPTNGLGQVTVSATLSGSTIFNTATGSYGSFYDTTIQTNVAGTARSMSLNTTDITNGVSISGSTNPFNTYIKVVNAGVYDIQFSAQVDKTDSGTDEIWIWIRKNGTNISDSATSIELVGNGAHYVAAWNFFVNAAAGDYFQLMWYSPDANVRLHAESAFGVVPGIPSLIVTANRVDQFLSNTGSFSGSFTGAFTGSFSGSGTITSASYAATASLAPLYLPLAGGTISGDVTVLGTASINTLIVNQIGYSSGSNQLGDAANDTQTLYGSVIIPTGSLIVSGTLAVTSSAIIQTLTVGLGVGRVASNTALGYQALNANTTGASNVAIGYQSGLLMSTGANNSSLGYFSLRLNTTGSGNTALGNYAMSANVGGNNSTGVGSFALQNTTGNNNTGIGNQSLVTNTSGINNTALGQGSLYYNTTASNNTAVGYRALQTNTIGADNTSMGVDSLLLNSTGSSNVAIGKESLRSTTTSTNTAIGYQAGYNNTSGANNIFIGANSTGASATDSNRTWIGNSSTTSTWLAGNVLIGTTTDAGFKLDVNGTARVKDVGSELSITSPLSAIAPVIFTTKGASGGYRGGYNFKGGYGGTAGNTIFIIDTANTDAGSRVGIGNFVFSDLASAKFSIDNTQSGGRNAAIRLRANFANNSTEYNGIDFNAYTGTDIGGFIGSQRNTATSGFGADIVVIATLDTAPSTYVEIARFIGRYNSFYVGTDKTLAVPSAKMQVESTSSGFLPPRMTLAQRVAISSPASGLIVYETGSAATEGLWLNETTGWQQLLSNSGSQSISGSLTVTGGITGSITSASYALSASYAPSSPAFPYTGSARITGSLDVIGTTTITGSLFVSQSLDTSNRLLYDLNSVQSIDWTTRALSDSVTQTSIDWEGRILYDLNGTVVLNYDSPANGYKIFSSTYYLSLLDFDVQEYFSSYPSGSSGEVNCEGEVIAGVLDGTVVNHDLVYLSSSGTWYQLTQGTDQCSKLIGICVNASKNYILLEGSLTVTSNISATDSPFVQGIAAGLPIYIKDSSGTKMSTTSPTGSGQYARVLGHAYYNSTTYTDYWTMKFRPSNDWFQNN
jgi:hypothetical protein